MAKIPTIEPNAIFTLQTAQATLALKNGCLPREIRLRRLRVSKRAGKYFILGAWLLQWIEAGEVRRERPEHGTTERNGVTTH